VLRTIFSEYGRMRASRATTPPAHRRVPAGSRRAVGTQSSAPAGGAQLSASAGGGQSSAFAVIAQSSGRHAESAALRSHGYSRPPNRPSLNEMPLDKPFPANTRRATAGDRKPVHVPALES